MVLSFWSTKIICVLFVWQFFRYFQNWNFSTLVCFHHHQTDFHQSQSGKWFKVVDLLFVWFSSILCDFKLNHLQISCVCVFRTSDLEHSSCFCCWIQWPIRWPILNKNYLESISNLWNCDWPKQSQKTVFEISSTILQAHRTMVNGCLFTHVECFSNQICCCSEFQLLSILRRITFVL